MGPRRGLGAGPAATSLALAALTLSSAGCFIDFEKYDPRLGSGGGTGASGGGGSGAAGGAGASGGAGAGGGGEGGSGATGGAGGVGGAGGTPACGVPGVIADDFADGVIDTGWFYGASGGASLEETGGERVVHLPNGGGASWGGWSSSELFDLRGHRAFIRVPTVANTSTTANAFFHVVYDSDNFITVGQRAGSLLIAHYLGGVWTEIASVAYDAAQHLYWQLREEGDTVYWETSADGLTWSTHASRPVSAIFPMDLVQVEFGGSTEGGEVNPGEVHFDDLMGGTPTGERWCPMSTLTEDFSASTPSRMWTWNSYSEPACTSSQATGALVHQMSGAVAECSYVSAQNFDLTNDVLSVEAVQIPTNNFQYTFFRADIDFGNGVEFTTSEGTLYFRVELAGSTQVVSSVLYSPSQHRYWRLRHEATAVHWDSSPNGVDWTEQTSAQVALDFSQMRVLMGAGCGANTTAGTASFDNLNLTP